MQLDLSYDMRAPEFGPSAADLHAAMLDQVEWADALGFDSVGIGEHHCSPDGYNPSPLVLAAAMGGRSRNIRLRTCVLLAPLYDPIKLAEDAAVTQLVTGGRLDLGIGGGYRPAEFEMFGRKLEDRWGALGEVIELLRLAWTGEPFEWRGRRCRVTPKPEPAPRILLGGGSAAAARRAARIADGWYPPLDPRLWPPYREACIELGQDDPGPYPKQGPIFLWISKEPERAWDRLMPHVLHQLRSYSEWTVEAYGRPVGPYAKDMTEETAKQSPAYQVLTPEGAIALGEQLGDDSVFFLNPLLAGIEPEFSWEMLRLYEREVHPYLRRG
ncbi:MAG: LLM class flavin-dependent oxidoreductase [Deltaproteobacteria bacterium]|nr:LLM class flavin-dependent oxidoreductase [Deltaproteobacteria bacterium]MBW2360724.1 LLM class flavin-dependent oxidoreductase [Deltaproteobacteria bacterium]